MILYICSLLRGFTIVHNLIAYLSLLHTFDKHSVMCDVSDTCTEVNYGIFFVYLIYTSAFIR